MDQELLGTTEAAKRLGISVATLYGWLADSDAGEFVIRGEAVTISYLQGGCKGQGRIQIPRSEIERIQELMRVSPKAAKTRRAPRPKTSHRFITSRPGRPED